MHIYLWIIFLIYLFILITTRFTPLRNIQHPWEQQWFVPKIKTRIRLYRCGKLVSYFCDFLSISTARCSEEKGCPSSYLNKRFQPIHCGELERLPTTRYIFTWSALHLFLIAARCFKMFRFNFAYTKRRTTSSFIHNKWKIYSYRFTTDWRRLVAQIEKQMQFGLKLSLGNIDFRSFPIYTTAAHISPEQKAHHWYWWGPVSSGEMGDDLCKAYSNQ